jgi:hypothetical protein
MRNAFVLTASVALACLGTVSAAHAADEPAAPKQAELEAKFAATMSHAVMRGGFTLGEIKPDEALKEDKYTLGEVKKLDSGKWLFSTRIQYGDHDVTVPLILDVVWAGDTPVITLTKFTVPGLGMFTARVLVYGDQYAGTWDGGDHGGHLFGVIERPEKKAADAPAETK